MSTINPPKDIDLNYKAKYFFHLKNVIKVFLICLKIKI